MLVFIYDNYIVLGSLCHIDIGTCRYEYYEESPASKRSSFSVDGLFYWLDDLCYKRPVSLG